MMVKYNPETERYIISMDADEAHGLAEDLMAPREMERGQIKLYPSTFDMLRQLDFFYWCAHDDHLNEWCEAQHGEEFANGE